MCVVFVKQKTAYEMRISDGVQTCALPILPIRRLGAIITRSNDGAVLSPQSIVGGIVLMPYSNASPARSLAGVLPVEAANQGFGVIVGHLSPRYRMTLLGAFRLSAPDGQRLEITSKKAIALLALLSTAETGERWR